MQKTEGPAPAHLPADFLTRLELILAPGDLERVLTSFHKTPPVALRVNTLKCETPQARSTLQAAGFHLEPFEGISDAFLLTRGSLRDLEKTPLFEQGGLYVQGLSSMLPVLALDPQPGESVLDMAAAPGSKTTQMAVKMQNAGTIVANELSRSRFFKLKANLAWQGVRNTDTKLGPGEMLGRRYPEKFDRVLLDAPCSGEGRFHCQEPESFSTWKASKLKGLASRQKSLFYAGFHALKPGGVMVYATCTYAPEENEGILDWAFEKFGDAMTLLPADFPFKNLRSGLAGWKGKPFDPRVQQGIRVLPDAFMEGFFFAKILKKA